LRSIAQGDEAVCTSVYGHLVEARGAFDARVVAAWLNDLKADAAERVERGLCEQLYSAREFVRLALRTTPPSAATSGRRARRFSAGRQTLEQSFAVPRRVGVIDREMREAGASIHRI
jgi:hypothetical protein